MEGKTIEFVIFIVFEWAKFLAEEYALYLISLLVTPN